MDTTAVVMETVQTTGWPTQQEAADALGVSTKTIQKYVAQKKLRQEMQSQINKPARAVIEPEGLERMVRERSRAGEEQTPNTSLTVPERGSSVTPATLRELFAGTSLPPSELAHKLYLTEDEAVRYTGIGRGHLRTLTTTAGRRIGPRGAVVYRRVELEGL